MAIILQDFYDGQVILDNLAERKARSDESSFMLENILPYMPVEDLEYEHIVGEYFEPIAATFSAFEVEGEYRGRDGVKKFIEELRPIKQSIRLSGKLMIQAERMKSESPLIAQLFKDTENVYDGVRVRTELMREEVLTTGGLNIDENGVGFSVDYGVPADNKVTISDAADKWDATDTSDPIADMVGWYNDLDFEPVGGIISKEILNYLLDNDNVRTTIFGTDFAGRVPTLTELNSYLRSRGLPPLVVNRDKYRANDASRTKKNIWTANKFVWVGANIGNTLVGPTEEGVLNEGVVRTENGIYVQVNKQKQPVRITSHASATSLVALPGVNDLFIADVYTV